MSAVIRFGILVMALLLWTANLLSYRDAATFLWNLPTDLVAPLICTVCTAAVWWPWFTREREFRKAVEREATLTMGDRAGPRIIRWEKLRASLKWHSAFLRGADPADAKALDPEFVGLSQALKNLTPEFARVDYSEDFVNAMAFFSGYTKASLRAAADALLRLRSRVRPWSISDKPSSLVDRDEV